MAWRHPNRIWQAAVPTETHLVAFVAEAQAHVVLDFVDDFALLQAYVKTATDAVERYTQRLLIKRSCTLRLPCLPLAQEAIELPGGPVEAVTLTVDGVAVSPFTAEVIGDNPAVWMPAAEWPVATGEGWPVKIEYLAGYDDTAVPSSLRIGVMIVVKDLYETRGLGPQNDSGLPPGAEAILKPWRRRPIG